MMDVFRAPANGRRLAVISPHFDDAVFACGALLAGWGGDRLVLTVFSGAPPADTPVTEWDRRCGFERSDEAMRVREQEDSTALALLGAERINLGLLDDQYAPAPDPRLLSQALAAALRSAEPDVVIMPIGLFHHDHIRVSDAALAAWPLFKQREWLAYSDALYWRKPGLLQARLADLLARQVEATPTFFPEGRPADKVPAVAAYASQLRSLGLTPGRGDDAAPECYWQLAQRQVRDP